MRRRYEIHVCSRMGGCGTKFPVGFLEILSGIGHHVSPSSSLVNEGPRRLHQRIMLSSIDAGLRNQLRDRYEK